MHATYRLGKSKTCFLGNCSKRYGTWRTSLVGPAGGGFGFTSPGKALCGVGNGFEVLFCTMARRRSSCLLLHLGSKLCVKAASRAGAILRTLPATCPGLIYSTRRHAASSPEQALSVALSQSAARYRSRDHAQHPATPRASGAQQRAWLTRPSGCRRVCPKRPPCSQEQAEGPARSPSGRRCFGCTSPEDGLWLL